MPDRDRHPTATEDRSFAPRTVPPATAGTPAPTQSDREGPEPDRTPPEQPHSATAPTQAQQELQPQSSTPQPPDRDRRSAASGKPEFPEWMTAKQAFQAPWDPGDRDSSIS